MIAEIIAVGSEMLTPYRQDTNSLALTAELNKLGVSVAFKTILGDSLPQLIDAIRIALHRADIVMISGGLGPTEDDLTREAVAAALGVGMTRNEAVVDSLRERFLKRGIAIREINFKQGDVIDGAELLPNANGTAPGQWIHTTYEGNPRTIVLLPGPPKELTALYNDQVRSRLQKVVPQQAIATRMLRMAVLPESEVDARTAPIYTTFTDVQTTILSTNFEIQLHFVCAKPTLEEAQARVDELLALCETEMIDFVFSNNGDSLESVLVHTLAARSLTLATAESCTGGILAQRLTSIAGASQVFLGGVVAYDNSIKIAFADVPAELIERHGAVSEQVARALAEGIRRRTGASLGLGVTGIAGPTGGTPEKPVGTVHVALATPHETHTLHVYLNGDRDRIRSIASQHALVMLRRNLS